MKILIRTVRKRIGNLSGKDVGSTKIEGQHRQYVECGFYKESGTKNTDFSYFLFLRDGLFQGLTHHEILLYLLGGNRKRWGRFRQIKWPALWGNKDFSWQTIKVMIDLPTYSGINTSWEFSQILPPSQHKSLWLPGFLWPLSYMWCTGLCPISLLLHKKGGRRERHILQRFPYSQV